VKCFRNIYIYYISFLFVMIYCCSIQYLRHLHDKVDVIHTRTAPKKEDKSVVDHPGAELMGLGSTLMIGNAPYMGGGGMCMDDVCMYAQ
jgi:hypothetical protein